MAAATEAELVDRISQGDQDAYNVILDAQLPSVARYVNRMLGSSTYAEDITQEVFVRLWTHAGRYDPSVAKLTTWLHNIAHNLCIDHFRKHNRFVDEPVEQDTIDGGDEPDRAYFDAVNASDIKFAIMQLPERQRSALVLCHYQGLSNREAADILEVSIDALESLLARGRRTLKSHLQTTVDGQ